MLKAAPEPQEYEYECGCGLTVDEQAKLTGGGPFVATDWHSVDVCPPQPCRTCHEPHRVTFRRLKGASGC